MGRKIVRFVPPHPPAREQLPLVNAGSTAAHWLDIYWRKLNLPADQAQYLAITDDRREFAQWTGRRLNTMALGCYCYLPLDDDASESESSVATTSNLTAPAATLTRSQLPLPGLVDDGEYTMQETPAPASGAPSLAPDFRHLIFIEPDLLPEGIEVTVAHELIHLSDRVHGQPRKHHCHGHDSISVDEAAITGRDPEWLRDLLAAETVRREEAVRRARPYKHVYVCPNCGKEYPRVRRYSKAVSCGHCDNHFNAAFLLRLRPYEAADETAGDEADQME